MLTSPTALPLPFIPPTHPLPLQYPLLLTRLADAGYTCIATPFAVTFNHVGCARDMHAAFLAAVAQLRAGRGAWAAPAGLPTHGVGHSNGALLHALIGAVCLPEGGSSGAGFGGPAAAAAAAAATAGQAGAAAAAEAEAAAGPRASNVLMSFNNLQASRPWGLARELWMRAWVHSNRLHCHSQVHHAMPMVQPSLSPFSMQVREAVPVPLDALKPAVQQLRGSDGRLSALAAQGLQQAAAVAQQLGALPGPLAPPALREQQERLLAAARQWDPALLQLGSVFDEVRSLSCCCGVEIWPPACKLGSVLDEASFGGLLPLACGCLCTPMAACASPCPVAVGCCR